MQMARNYNSVELFFRMCSDSYKSAQPTKTLWTIRAARGVMEHVVILCFERRSPKQNSVICLKSHLLPPQKIFGLATPLLWTWTYQIIKGVGWSEALQVLDGTV